MTRDYFPKIKLIFKFNYLCLRINFFQLLNNSGKSIKIGTINRTVKYLVGAIKTQKSICLQHFRFIKRYEELQT